MEPALHRPQFTETSSGTELKNQEPRERISSFCPVCFSFPEPDKQKPISSPYLDRLHKGEINLFSPS
jgi:hypothetical protein